MSEHAILSASSAHRWLACTPSARLELEFDDNSGAAADEGTAAHALAEHKLRKALKMRSKKPVSKYDSDEMDAHTDDYVSFVLEQIAQAKQRCSDPMVLIEQKLDFSKLEVLYDSVPSVLSELMDAETWMNANKAIELGFADKILFMESDERIPLDTGQGLIFSRAAVYNSLLGKMPKKPKPKTGTPIEQLEKRLFLISHYC